MQKVFFDSSFLMAVVERPTTWFEDIVDGVGKFEPVLLECVKCELQAISEGQGRRARWARVALEVASKFSGAPCGEASVDDELVSAAASAKGLVATTDADLMRSLEGAHVRVVTLSGGRVSLR